MAAKPICSIPDCDKPLTNSKWCNMHYKRWLRHGDPMAGRTPDGAPLAFYEQEVLTCSRDECLIWPFSTYPKGYPRMYYNGKNQRVNRLICKGVYGDPDPYHEAAHSCGNKMCVNPRHLRWATHVENVADKVAHGTTNRGSNNGLAKLSEIDVRAIRRDDRTAKEASKDFGVSQATIYDIRRGKSWSWLSD